MLCRISLACLSVAAALAQAPVPSSTPAFEVVSIKEAEPITREMVIAGRMHIGMKVDNARVEIQSFNLQELIRYAYSLKPYQVSGPDWITHLRYNITAKLPEGANMSQIRGMVQRLLAERFQLVFHHETKELPIYALIVLKDGPKLKEADPSAVIAPTGDAPREMNVGGTNRLMSMTGGSFGNLKLVQDSNEQMHLVSEAATIGNLTDMLDRMLDRPVIDMTNLTGNYQFRIDVDDQDLRAMAAGAGVSMPLRGNAGDASDPSHRSVFQSLQRIGLKLEPRKAPVDNVVVDSAAKSPLEN